VDWCRLSETLTKRSIVWSISVCAGLGYFKSNDQTGICCRCVAGAHENIAKSDLYLLCFSWRFVSAGHNALYGIQVPPSHLGNVLILH
jgi:hypothetical protein